MKTGNCKIENSGTKSQGSFTRKRLIELYRSFFESKEHIWLPSASLVPENDPTALFNSAGMQPLVPFLLGQPHPAGKRLANVQKCLRTGDIDEVGDKVHHTFFEMLGNWSLGDYWKKEAIEWSWEFLTSPHWLNLDKEKLAVSVFAGDSDAPFDQESYDLWLEKGLRPERIAKLGKKDNWWGPAGITGPCGPDTEMFYWTGESPAPVELDPTNTQWVEIWNDVFMEYNKTADGEFEPLKQKNVDTGMGLARMLAVLNGFDDDYQTELFLPLIQRLEKEGGKQYCDQPEPFRIIADHFLAAILAIADGVVPSNKGAGYVVRRLIRRAMVKARRLGLPTSLSSLLLDVALNIYASSYSELSIKKEVILTEIAREEEKFKRTLEQGIKELKRLFNSAIGGVDPENPGGIRLSNNVLKGVDGSKVFYIYQAYGFPPELSQEIMASWGLRFDETAMKECDDAMKAHQEKSRSASAGMFKGGLADGGEATIKHHTAAHLLLAALRRTLGEHVVQRGSNITPERIRFDFSHPEKLTDVEISEVERLVNEQIDRNIPVAMEEMTVNEAKQSGAEGVFDDRYGSRVKVYAIGDFSKEICGGPHADNTGDLGRFKIIKEEASSQGVRRIKAVLE